MALVLELDETRDGIVVSRGGERSVLRTFGIRENTLLLGLDYGLPQLAELDLELGRWYSMTLHGIQFRLKAETRRGGHLAVLLQADLSLGFKRLSANTEVKAAA